MQKLVGASSLHPDSPETQVTVEFFVRGNTTEVVLTHAVFGSAKDRDHHKQGWSGYSLARIL
ncbi:MAG: SRPBCC domain-containing protein [Candidatus Acidiferrum sp.]